jgi:hypothetical protein
MKEIEIENVNENENETFNGNGNQNENENENNKKTRTKIPSFNLKNLITDLKKSTKNPTIKNLINEKKLEGVIRELFSGNYFIKNLNVMDLSIFKEAEIRNKMTVKGISKMNKIKANKIETNVMNITDNEIIFNPNAILKFSTKAKNINFKVRDIFEVIIFLKFIKAKCGKKLEKCDMRNLLKNRNQLNKNNYNNILKHFENKLEKVNATITSNITREIHGIFEKKKLEDVLIMEKLNKEKEKLYKKIKENEIEKENKILRKKFLLDKEKKEKQKEKEIKEKLIKEKLNKLRINKKDLINNKNNRKNNNINKNTNNKHKIKAKKEIKIKKEIIKGNNSNISNNININNDNDNDYSKNKLFNNDIFNDDKDNNNYNINNDIDFLSKFEKIENKGNDFEYQSMLNDEVDDDYDKFLKDPMLSDAISNYYYDINQIE